MESISHAKLFPLAIIHIKINKILCHKQKIVLLQNNIKRLAKKY